MPLGRSCCEIFSGKLQITVLSDMIGVCFGLTICHDMGVHAVFLLFQ